MRQKKGILILIYLIFLMIILVKKMMMKVQLLFNRLINKIKIININIRILTNKILRIQILK